MFISKKRPTFPAKELLAWVQILRTLLQANIELYQALNFCQESLTKKKSRQLMQAISRNLHEGSSLASALQTAPFKLPDIFIGMMSIGEKSGTLANTLGVLEQYLLNAKRIKDKLLSALMYPLLVLLVMVIGSFFIALFIIPSLIEATQSINVQNDGSLVDSLIYLQKMQWSLLLTLFFSLMLFSLHKIFVKKSVSYLYYYDKMKIKAPVIRYFWGTLIYWHFSFYMQSLLASGMRVEQALLEVTHFLPNTFLSKEIKEIHANLLKGMRVEESFRESSFPREFTLWLSVSAQTGDSLASFTLLQKYYEERFQQYIDRLTALIDPILILVIGVILLIFITQFITPFFGQLTDLVTFF